MKRLLVALTGLITLGVGTAQAIPGPDPVDEHQAFEISITARDAPIGEPFTVSATDTTTFDEGGGWDFGDRVAYACAWVEFYQQGTKWFEVAYHAVGDYPGFLRINDKNGLETEEDTPLSLNELCLEGSGVTQRSDFRADGSDHFPHGAALVFYRDRDGDGRVDPTPSDEFARVDYSEATHGVCGNLYWTPGDEPAEAWLWWDEDGAADRLGHGDGLCGGGPMEPVAVVQAEARSLAGGVMACVTDAMDGDMCTGVPATSAHASRITLTLRGSLRAIGFVHVPDGTAMCGQDRTVVIERRASSGWTKVGRDRTSDNGRYSEHVRNRNGVYRASVRGVTLANGETCKADVSRRRTFPN
jgi:hypothetical protein